MDIEGRVGWVFSVLVAWLIQMAMVRHPSDRVRLHSICLRFVSDCFG